MLALFLVVLDQTVVGTPLPKTIADLDGLGHYARITTAYLLASTAMIPVIDKLGDIYDRKWFSIESANGDAPARPPPSPTLSPMLRAWRGSALIAVDQVLWPVALETIRASL